MSIDKGLHLFCDVIREEELRALTISHYLFFFFFSSRRRHTRFDCDWSSDVCSSDLARMQVPGLPRRRHDQPPPAPAPPAPRSVNSPKKRNSSATSTTTASRNG